MGLSVVVPVYNSQDLLETLVGRLQPLLAALSDCYELVLVNDGSRDRSWEVVCRLAAEYPWITGINLMRNYGQHNALLCGILQAEYDIIITMDDDLQHPPEEIPKLLAKLDEGYDVVYGTPEHEQHGLWRDLASQVTKMALQSAMGVDTARNVSAFRAFRTQIRDAFRHYQGPYVVIDVLLTWGTTRFTAVPVRHDPRRIGVSNYTLRKLISHALNMLTGFSIMPLRLASLLGFGATGFGMLVLVYVLARYLLDGGSVPGFAFLASITAIFSGTQLLTLGILGEYFARMYFRSMGRPPSVIRDIVGAGIASRRQLV